MRDTVGTIIVHAPTFSIYLCWADNDYIDGSKYLAYMILFKYTKNIVFDGDIKVLSYLLHLHNGMDPLKLKHKSPVLIHTATEAWCHT
jgi:hypothetical protein